LPITPDIVPSGITVTVNMLYTSLNPLRFFLLVGEGFRHGKRVSAISTKTTVKKTGRKAPLAQMDRATDF
jgi:hypothetical protein